MTASMATIKGWLHESEKAGANFMVVACDQDMETKDDDPGCCYPVRVFAETCDDVHQAQHREMASGSRVQEIYDLRADIDAQLRLRRCWLSPVPPEGESSQKMLADPPTRAEILDLEKQTNERRAVQTSPSPRRATTTSRRVVAKPAPTLDDAKTKLERELESGVGGLTGRLARLVDDKDDDE